MRNCEDIKSKIEQYIDNQLDQEETKALKLHLETCPDCQKELEFAFAIRKSLKQITLPEPPVDFLDKVNAAIDSQQTPKQNVYKRFLNRRVFQAAAACVLIAVILRLNTVNLTDKLHNDNTDVTLGRDEQLAITNETSEAYIADDPENTTQSEKTEAENNINSSTSSNNRSNRNQPTNRQPTYKERTNEPIASLKSENPDLQLPSEPEKNTNAPEPSTTAATKKTTAEPSLPDNTHHPEEPVSAQYFAEENEENAEGSTETGQIYDKGATYKAGGFASEESTATSPTHKKASDGVICVIRERLTETENIAMHYGSVENGIYGMTSEKYQDFLDALDKAEIEYTSTVEGSSAVRFTIDAQ